MKKHNIIPYEIIKKAVAGDVESINMIVDFYTPYIKVLATVECVGATGKNYRIVDDEIYNRVKTKLIKKILEFKPVPFKTERSKKYCEEMQ